MMKYTVCCVMALTGFGGVVRSQTPGSITRATAKALITQAAAFQQSVQLTLAEGAAEGGIKEGIFFYDRASYGTLTPTVEGRKIFAGVSSTVITPLTGPAKLEVVEVTGIADAALGTKEVHFTWRYIGLSAEVARYSGQGSSPHDGTAFLRLYDDGWRVERINAKETGRVPFRYDQTRLQRIQQALADEDRLATIQKEQERVAKTPTRTIASFTLSAECPRGSENFNEFVQLDVKDAGVDVKRVHGNGFDGFLGYWEFQQVAVSNSAIICGFGKQSRAVALQLGRAVINYTGDMPQLERIVLQIDAVRRAWNDRFQDRVTWRPTTSGAPAITGTVSTAAPVRVGGNIRPPRKVKDVRPVSSKQAQAMSVEGTVIVEITINVDGRVSDAKVVRSIPLLDDAAIAAVRQWEFEPPQVNGMRTPVIMTVSVTFQ
jgi:TonB family protein